MGPTFVYSFDRESFTGRYATRADALAAALKHALAYPNPINTVYVGQQVQPKPHTYGHARAVIDAMRRRVRDEVGDAADSYLRKLPDAQVADLDREMEKTTLAWLERHDLMPNFPQVDAISEHPVPVSASGGLEDHAGERDDEVHELGESRYFG
jgi:hypothetical protein